MPSSESQEPIPGLAAVPFPDVGIWELQLTDSPGPEKGLLRWSDEVFRIAGYEPGSVEVTRELVARLVPQEDHQNALSAIAAAIREKRSCSVVHRLIRPDGEERFVFQTTRPILENETGRVVRLAGTTLDITEQRKSEQALRASEYQFASAFEHASIGMALVAPEGRFIRVNNALCRMLGYPAEELLAKTFQDITHPADLNADEENVRQLLSGDSLTYQMEKRYFHKLGQIVWVSLSVSLVRDDSGSPVHFISQIQDVTERKDLERQFLRAQRIESIGTLAGGIAHDLNNVLAPISMAIDLLRRHVADHRGTEILDLIDSSARRGAEMVGQVLAFAKGAEGNAVDMRIPAVAKDVLRIVDETFPKNIEVVCLMEPELWAVHGDATHIHQVLLNLCLNARDAMPVGGRLFLRASNLMIDEHRACMNLEATLGPHVKIEVDDTGVGIPPEIADKLFDPFFTTKEPGKGTGLGLSTSLAIVKSHGGFMRYDSEPGKGTVFQIFLPAIPEAQGTIPVIEAETESPRGHGEMVLIADDEPSIRQICRQTLENAGYRVLLAGDGAEAVSIYQKYRGEIGVVVTDMMMPVMDGARTIRELMDLDPQVKIICISGIGANEKFATSHGGHFLPKPFTADALLRAIRTRLSEGDETGAVDPMSHFLPGL